MVCMVFISFVWIQQGISSLQITTVTVSRYSLSLSGQLMHTIGKEGHEGGELYKPYDICETSVCNHFSLFVFKSNLSLLLGVILPIKEVITFIIYTYVYVNIYFQKLLNYDINIYTEVKGTGPLPRSAHGHGRSR